MNGMRKLFYFSTAILLAMFALSANAAKTITLTNSSTAGQPAFLGVTLATGTVYVQLNNTGTSGNASSLELDWTNTPQFTVNSGTINTSKGTATGTLITGQTPGGYKGIQFTFTLPQKSSIVIALNVTVNAGATCGAQQVTWQPYAWTGGVGTPSSSFSSPSLGTYTSKLPGAPDCSLSFFNQPADAFVSSVITTVPFNSTAAPVKVQAMQGGSTPVSGVSVSMGSTGGSCSISGSATTDGTGTATLTSISSSAAGDDCQLTATAAGFTSATSNAFDVVQQQGILSCNPTDPNNAKGNLNPDAVPPLGAPDWGLKRGLNTDATCGADVPFTLVVDGNTNTAHFTEDSLGQPTSVEYIIRWATVPVDGDKWSAKQPCVSWGVPNPVYGEDGAGVCVGDYVPAVACVSNNVSGGTAVMPFIPNAYPFNDQAKEPAASYPQYQVGIQAKVCIAQQGWTSDSSLPGVQYWHKFIDQADTGIRLP
jgi:hypothetical protein